MIEDFELLRRIPEDDPGSSLAELMRGRVGLVYSSVACRPARIAISMAGLLWFGAMSAAERLPARGELEAIYQPFRTEQAALAPDGRHLAYTLRQDRRLDLVLAVVDKPG